MNINDEMKLRTWAQDMANQKASGLSQKKWCSMHGIALSTFQYRCRKVCQAMEETLTTGEQERRGLVTTESDVITQVPEPCFAKVEFAQEIHTPSGIKIEFQNASVTIAPDTPNQHVRTVLEVLANA